MSDNLSVGEALAEAPDCSTGCEGTYGLKHDSLRTEAVYLDWIRRFILHHGKRHPDRIGAAEVAVFLMHLVVAGKMAAATQNQGKSPLRFP